MTSEIKQVPLLDLRRLAPDLKAELEDAFKRCLLYTSDAADE